MASKPGSVVLPDTNAFIEAYRLRVAKAWLNAYQVETVESCFGELAAGDPHGQRYVRVDVAVLRPLITVHAVTPAQIMAAAARCDAVRDLDEGERDLLAHALSRNDGWVLCSADRACVQVGHGLGVLDRFVSLEGLLQTVGNRAQCREHHTERWLAGVRSDLKLESI